MKIELHHLGEAHRASLPGVDPEDALADVATQ